MLSLAKPTRQKQSCIIFVIMASTKEHLAASENQKRLNEQVKVSPEGHNFWSEQTGHLYLG